VIVYGICEPYDAPLILCSTIELAKDGAEAYTQNFCFRVSDVIWVEDSNGDWIGTYTRNYGDPDDSDEAAEIYVIGEHVDDPDIWERIHRQ
jgi:hypothetical protein